MCPKSKTRYQQLSIQLSSHRQVRAGSELSRCVQTLSNRIFTAPEVLQSHIDAALNFAGSVPHSQPHDAEVSPTEPFS